MQSILVINSKGGSGKTTIATNISSYYAKQGKKTALMDYDPQGSSLHWLKTRPFSKNPIHGSEASPAKKGKLRSWQMALPPEIETLIIDAPAGVNGIVLQEMTKKAKTVIIPVAPSSIDIHATADFIKELLLVGKVQPHVTHVAVVANRARSNMPLYEPLLRFLKSLSIPFVTTITDSHRYIEAAEKGLGIFDLDPNDVSSELAEFAPLLQWIENPGRRFTGADAEGQGDGDPNKLVYFKRGK